MLKKFKICPDCGTKNEPNAIECIECDSDLTGVRVTDEEAEQAKIKSDNQSEPHEADKNKLVRICDCGVKNPPNARKCTACGEDISDVVPTSDNQIKSVSFQLSSLDGKLNFKIEDNEMVIGRENGLKDYLVTKTFVSRKHCRITIENDELFVEDLNSSNSTYINNKRVECKTKLSAGDELALGGLVRNGSRQEQAAYFVVKVN